MQTPTKHRLENIFKNTIDLPKLFLGTISKPS